MMRRRGSSREAERSKHIITSPSEDVDIVVKHKLVDLGEHDQTLEEISGHFVADFCDFEACPNTANLFPDFNIQNKLKCPEFLSKVEQPVTQCGTEIYDARTSTVEVEKAAVSDANIVSKEGKCCSRQEQRKCFPHQKQRKCFPRQEQKKCFPRQEQKKCFPRQRQILLTCFEVLRHIGALIFLALFVPVSFADPVYNKTLQELPAACMAQIKLMHECPQQNLAHMTNLCCADFPGTHLHCQQEEAPGFVTWVFPACLKAQKVGGGVSVKLVINNTGYPDLEIIQCLGWDTGSRMTNEVLEPCIPIHTKIDCSLDKGRQMLCSGGGSRDDKCVCAPKYEPANWPVVFNKCLEGFDSNDPSCGCVYKPCSDGNYRNITIPLKAVCDDVVITALKLNYTCIPIPNLILTITEIAEAIVTTERPKINTSDVIVTTERSKINTSSDVGNKTTDDLVGLWVSLGLCGVGLVGFLIYCVWKKKCSKSNTASCGTSNYKDQLECPEITDEFHSDDTLLE